MAREPIGLLDDCSMRTGAYGVFDAVGSGLEHLFRLILSRASDMTNNGDCGLW